MNIFVLDYDPSQAAYWLCDQHVNKMLLESAQIMSTIAGGPYKPFNPKHPAVLWAGYRSENMRWLTLHAQAMHAEYWRRFGRVHKSSAVITQLRGLWKTLPEGRTDFVQCMPDKYRGPCPVEAYRRFYVNEKARFATWKANRPAWMDDESLRRQPSL